MRLKKTTLNNIITYALVIAAFIVCQLLIEAGSMTRSLRGQLVPICVYIVMAVSLNLTVGISGELSLGHAGFMSVGAFSGIVTSAWLLGAFTMENETVRLILSMLVGGVFAACAGVIVGVPVLRLRGDYLAIVTLAFGEIIRNVINCLYVAVEDGRVRVAFNDPKVAGKLVINGPAGATGVSQDRHVWHGLCANSLYAVCGAQPDQQPLRPGDHGRARQPYRRRVGGHQRHQIPHDGLCHLGDAGGHGGGAVRAELLDGDRVEVQV